MIEAVIFDMDGVLIDSEIAYLDFLYRGLKEKYPWVEREALFSIVGSCASRTRAILASVLKMEVDDPLFEEEYAKMWDGCVVDYPSILRPQVTGLLKELKNRGYKVALASSTNRKGIDAVLSSCEITQYFDYVVSGEEFKESKPHPEIYIHTAQSLGISTSSCLVVEDSTYGITAGHEAGAVVAAMIDDRFGFDRTLADYSITNLGEVIQILDR